MNANDLLEPELLYKNQLKEQFHQNAEKFFDELKNASGVDAGANKVTCDKYYKVQNELASLRKQRSKKAFLRGFLIFLGVLFALGGIVMFILPFVANSLSDMLGLFIGLGVGALVLGILGIVLPIVLITPKIKELDEAINKQEEIANKLKQEAYAQMAPLNASYDFGMAAKLVTITCPLIQMDKNFNPTRFYQLNQKYGFTDDLNENESCVFVQSGTILGNPFLLQRDFVTHMGTETYTGSITIHWTTTYTDDKGTHTQHHTQVLTASLTKPKPFYHHNTCLIYGNDAASRLSFSRDASKANSMNDKDFEKLARNFEKELSKIQQKNIASGFTALGNAEFEALFHALDRDNEVEFRLLFTPLAQKSMLQIIKSKTPYGDDFSFRKKKCLNYIWSAHSQGFDYEGDPRKFIHFDLEAAKKIFVNYMDDYFCHFYHDLAPILAIPLYQQHKSQEYIYDGILPRNVTSFEAEAMANKFDKRQFEPTQNKTDIIIKSRLIRRGQGGDVYMMKAYGYDKIERLTLVPKMGGDGLMHDVPVTWYEYIPCSKETPFQVQNYNDSKKDATYRENLEKAKQLIAPFLGGSGIIAQRGLFSSVLSSDSGWNGDEFNKIFKDKEN